METQSLMTILQKFYFVPERSILVFIPTKK